MQHKMPSDRRLNLLRMGRRRKQSGELSLIEAGAYMAGAALLAIAVIKGSTSVSPPMGSCAPG
jgi:hypothetical protein